MRKVLFVAFGGFLGAGKTTAMTWLADSLRADGKRTAIVMNDQGEGLVDTAFGRATGLPVAEVTGGCFCCRFDDLVETSIGLLEQELRRAYATWRWSILELARSCHTSSTSSSRMGGSWC
jgi:G3E family GTPase